MLNQTAQTLSEKIKTYAKSIGLSDIGITDIDLSHYSPGYQEWTENHYHGSMGYMVKHGDKRWKPEKLIEGTSRVISFRLDYWPENDSDAKNKNNTGVHNKPSQHVALVDKIFDKDAVILHPKINKQGDAYISRYALGRDYHKVLRKKGQLLSTYILEQYQLLCAQDSSLVGNRVFVDSAPVLEKPLAEKAGLGWIGKHSNLINKDNGSWFFLGEIYTNLALPIDKVDLKNHCGSCTRCIQSCPTQAIVKPYQVNANLCISYLTIEHKDSIPVELRKPMGNRIYGCDDCQLVCPWNKQTELTAVEDFKARHNLDDISLLECFSWDEITFLSKTEGSAIRRIGYQKWLSNVAIGLGNANKDIAIIDALQQKKETSHLLPYVLEHIEWAILEQQNKAII